MDRIDCVVIGAGVVGLAIGRRMAMAGRETLILERESAFGTGISARNSEVIHAGLHYPRHSLRARLCVSGREQLYDYCRTRGIAHRRCGKLIVAADGQQRERLASIAATARDNGVEDLRCLDAGQVAEIAPELRCSAALLSPSTGIIDSHGLMQCLLADAESGGATLVLRSVLTAAERMVDGFRLYVDGDSSPALKTRLLINAAGLDAATVAASIEGLDPLLLPRLHYAKGSYFVLNGKSPFELLVYPVPEPGGLGIHLTLDLAGQARFGPDVEWIESPDYAVNPERSPAFYRAIRSYWPTLPEGALVPGYAGVRPKLSGPEETVADFRIDGPDQHGIPGLVNLFGIESPGLTACLAIADYVATIAEGG